MNIYCCGVVFLWLTLSLILAMIGLDGHALSTYWRVKLLISRYSFASRYCFLITLGFGNLHRFYRCLSYFVYMQPGKLVSKRFCFALTIWEFFRSLFCSCLPSFYIISRFLLFLAAEKGSNWQRSGFLHVFLALLR